MCYNETTKIFYGREIMKKMKKLLSIFLIAAMCLSLAACGGDKPEEKQEETPEYVYTAKYSTLSEGTDRYMNPQAFTDDGIYITAWEKVGEDIPEGAVVEYEGQYDVYENRIYFVAFDGTTTRLEGYAPMKAEDSGEGKTDYYANSGLNGLFLDNEGNLLALENVYANWYDGPEGITQMDEDYWMYMKYTEEYYLRKLNPDGSEISCAKIEVPEGQYLNSWGAVVDGDGNLVCSIDTGLAAIKPDGSYAYQIQHEEYIDRIVPISDGKLGALSWGEKGMVLLPVENGAFGEPLDLPYDAYNLYKGSGEYDFYYTSGINFFGYDLETATATKLFNWIDCDVNSGELNKLHITSDGKIISVLNSWDNNSETYTSELITVDKVPYESVPHKEVITLAAIYLDYQVQSQIIDFNRHNDKYRIEVKDYSEYNTDEDYSAGQTKLTTEIMAGNVPDILSLNGSLPYTQLAAKGILEDLYPYIDADAEFDRDDFFPNVLASLEVGGKLYSTVSGFYVNTLAGASSVVGDTPGWTYEEFNAALASMPEGCTAMDPYVTRDTILNTCLALDMQNFVDWTTGQCSFDSESFIELLKFANQFPAEYNWEENQVYESTDERIAQGKQMLMESYMFSIDEMMYSDRNFAGNMTYIGYPSNSGTGSMLNLETGYAMSSNCKNKEAAWEFLRMFFSEEYQQDVYSFPSNINVYNEKLERAMTPEYVKDADGNYLLNDQGEKIPVIQASWPNPDGTVTEVFSLTQEQADRMWDLITSTTKRADYNSEILAIVTEQATAFFEGQKSAEEVARLIQSKANIYVNEQR